MNGPDAKEFDIKTEPRPKGKATKVIITEYDLPRKEAMPHDVVLDANGHAWYSDFGSLVRRRARSQDRQGDRLSRCRSSARTSRTATLDLELDPQRQSLGRDDVPVRRGEDRHQDQGGQRLSVSGRMGGAEHAQLDGVAELLQRRQQGLVQQPGAPASSIGST